MSKIIVLGAGLVGSAIAIDLAQNHNVTLCDLDKRVLNNIKQKHDSLNTKELDVTTESELQRTIKHKGHNGHEGRNSSYFSVVYFVFKYL